MVAAYVVRKKKKKTIESDDCSQVFRSKNKEYLK